MIGGFMKKKILLVILFLVGVNGVYASDLESVKESNVKALSDYSFDVKYVNQDVNVKRNLEYVKKVYGGQEQGFYDENMYAFFYKFLVTSELEDVINFDGVMGYDMDCYRKGDTVYTNDNNSSVADNDGCSIALFYNDGTNYETTINGSFTEVSGDNRFSKTASDIAQKLQFGILNVADIDMINHYINYGSDSSTFFSTRNAGSEFSAIKSVIESNPDFDIFVGFEETRKGISMTGIAEGITYVKYDDIVYDFAFNSFYQSNMYYVPLGTKEEDYAKVLLDKIKKYIGNDNIDVSIKEINEEVYVDVSEVLDRVYGLKNKDYLDMIGSSFDIEYTKYKDNCRDCNSYTLDWYENNREIALAKRYTLSINGNDYEIGILPISDEYSKNFGVISSKDVKTGIILRTKSGNVPFDATLSADKYSLSEEEISLLKSNGYTNLDAYSLKLYSSILNKVISNFNGVTEVLIPISGTFFDSDLKMIYIRDNGQLEVYDVNKTSINGVEYLSFNTNHFSNYILAYSNSSIVNPATYDGIVKNVIIVIVSVIVLGVVIYIIRKRK